MRNKHLSFRSGNPALNANTFANYTSKGSQTMTIICLLYTSDAADE